MAVSLRLFASRAEELAPRLAPSLERLPPALRAAAAAAAEYGAVHRSAAAAAAAAGGAHARAAQAKVARLLTSAPSETWPQSWRASCRRLMQRSPAWCLPFGSHLTWRAVLGNSRLNAAPVVCLFHHAG